MVRGVFYSVRLLGSPHLKHHAQTRYVCVVFKREFCTFTGLVTVIKVEWYGQF